MAGLSDNQKLAAAMLRGLGHKWAVRGSADIRFHGDALALRYHQPIDVFWPRVTKVPAETMAFSLADIARINATHLRSADEPHYASVYNEDEARDETAFAAAGYDYLYTSSVMVHDLDGEPLRGARACVIEEVTTAAQMDEINAIDPQWISHQAALGDPLTVALCARDAQGAIRAKGDVVLGVPGIAYVADMFTAPDARGQGYGRAVLNGLHQAARKRGARVTTLMQSLMAHETGFYVHCGYRAGCSAALLLSKTAV
jgi:GNAT superfamily N-acetyltransferase